MTDDLFKNPFKTNLNEARDKRGKFYEPGIHGYVDPDTGQYFPGVPLPDGWKRIPNSTSPKLNDDKNRSNYQKAFDVIDPLNRQQASEKQKRKEEKEERRKQIDLEMKQRAILRQRRIDKEQKEIEKSKPKKKGWFS